MRALAGTITLVVLAGCGPDAIATQAIATGDVEAYVTQVHPVVRYSCGSLDCHGDQGRPLRLYSEDGLRARDALRGAPLDPVEADWNARSLTGIDPLTDLDQKLSLTKPLAVSAGGVAHAGGDVFASRDDPGYRCLRAWLAGESALAESVAACTEAAAVVAPPGRGVADAGAP